MSSGVSVNAECLEHFQDLKLRKKYKYIIFKLSDNLKEIEIENAEEPKDVSGKDYEEAYAEFLNKLPENEPRYAVYDFEFEKEGEGQRNKITFFSWIPDTSKVRQKMLYASSKDALRRQLVGLAVEIQGTDASEVSYETVLEKANRSA